MSFEKLLTHAGHLKLTLANGMGCLLHEIVYIYIHLQQEWPNFQLRMADFPASHLKPFYDN